MTALTAPRATPSLETGKNVWNTYPVAGSTKIFPGAQVALNATGYLVRASTATTLQVLGIASPKAQQMTRTGAAQVNLGYIDTTDIADGVAECEVQRCIALMANSSTSITKADIGNDCYAVDDQTVHRTDGSAAGTAQVTTGTVVYDNGSATGFTITGVVPTITVNAATSAAATATALANAANARADFFALYTATTNSADIIVTKKTAGTFTMTKVVAGAADITGLGTPTTTGVADTAATRSRAGKIHDVETRGVWVEYDAA